MKNIMGPPVQGADFFGRTTESNFAWKRIENGNNLTLAAPRRVGKTSFALNLLHIAKDKGWNTVSINLEKISTEHQFIELFIDHLKELSWWDKVKDKGNKFLSYFTKIKPAISYGDVKVDLTWESQKQDIYKQLSGLLDHSENTLIFFDELTILLASIINNGEEGQKNVRAFLHWLRDIRITTGSKIRWVYCSSVGIDNFTHKYGISDALNDIHYFTLKSFGKEESIKMLEILAHSNNLPLTKALSTAVVKKIDYCIPFFLQILFGKIHYLVEVEKTPLKTTIIDTAYALLIEENHFNTWVERINEQYTDDTTYAFRLLKHLCQAKEGAAREVLINLLVLFPPDPDRTEEICSSLLYRLQNDGYLMEEDGLYKFRSPLLRDFWFNRFVK